MNLDSTQTVAEIAQQYPATVPVFETLGIDYCCGGKRSLEEACRRTKLPVEQVISQLSEALSVRPEPEDHQWVTARLTDLSAHILERHHEQAKRELPRLSALAAKVEMRHGATHPELHQLRELVEAMASEMMPHMLKEEQILFPRLKVLEEAFEDGTTAPPAFFGALINPIRHMMSDHDDTGELLRSVRSLTQNYRAPDDACMSYKALFDGLRAFEADTHKHIHLENNILFPRALGYERDGKTS